MYNSERSSVRSGNMFTLTLATPVAIGKEPGDYDGLTNKPKINGIELVGNMTWEDFGIPDLSQLPTDLSSIPTQPLSNNELDELTD